MAGLGAGEAGAGGPLAPPPAPRAGYKGGPPRVAPVPTLLPPTGAEPVSAATGGRQPRATSGWRRCVGVPEPGSMIVDKLLDDSRGGEGLLDAAGDCGLMTSPLNLAYFYSASPPAAPGACEASWAASGPSAPGSPGSDSSDLSSASAVSSCGAVESRPRGSARAERLQGTPRPGRAARHPVHPRPPRSREGGSCRQMRSACASSLAAALGHTSRRLLGDHWMPYLRWAFDITRCPLTVCEIRASWLKTPVGQSSALCGSGGDEISFSLRFFFRKQL